VRIIERPATPGRGVAGVLGGPLARGWLVAALMLAACPLAVAEDSVGSKAVEPGTAPALSRTLDVNEYRVLGVTRLSTLDVELTLGPFLGPGRTLEDVEKARVALEKAYTVRGYQAVTVAIPQQTVRNGVVTLEVVEGKVVRLRVRGADWFSPFDIKELAPSVAEGSVPNFDRIVEDIVALNQIPDRRVAPSLRAGTVQGTIVVDLDVEDRMPLHGSLDLNNRYSALTTPLRLNGAVRYENLWQAGHSLAFAFQTAPGNLGESLVLSLSYLARFPRTSWLTLSATGVIQNSNVSTLGAMAVAGKGWMVGARASFTLPSTPVWFQSITAGLDYKYFLEQVDVQETPIGYLPMSAAYSASWMEEAWRMQVTASTVFDIRDWSSSPDAFDAKRYGSTGSFISFRGEASRTDVLPLGFEVSEKLLGQYSPVPLIGPEQFAVGGVDSVRGYLEAQALGDYGVDGQFEVRSPPLFRGGGKHGFGGLQILAFLDLAFAGIHLPLPEQKQDFFLMGAGGGGTFRAFGFGGGALEVGVPFVTVGDTQQFTPRIHFRVWGEF
jgi:hemolysin activation/secretion protein